MLMNSVCRLVLGFIIALLLAGCSSLSNNPMLTQTSLINHTPIISITASPIPTPFTPSPIISPTTAFVPTLLPAVAEAQVLEFLDNNGGCRFPCFWDITPGQTREKTVISFLHTFDSISPSVEIILPRDDLSVSVSVITEGGFNSKPDIVKWIEVDLTAYHKLKTKLEKDYSTPYYSEIFRYYTLPYLLSNYGIPENVYVFLDTGIADMGLGIDLYLLHLDYPKQGWVAHLEMPLSYKDNSIIGCPSEAFTKLRLWSPKEPSRDFALGSNVLFSIEEATGMSLEEFYQKFKDPSNTACLITPANIHK